MRPIIWKCWHLKFGNLKANGYTDRIRLDTLNAYDVHYVRTFEIMQVKLRLDNSDMEGKTVDPSDHSFNLWLRSVQFYIISLCPPQERAKALGYLQSNQAVAEQALEAMDEAVAQRPPDNVNELHIKVVRCEGLNSRTEGRLLVLKDF